jgi:hypothetical protein
LNNFELSATIMTLPPPKRGNTTRAAWSTCARVEQHPTSLYPTIDWFYASEMRSCCYCKRLSHTSLPYVVCPLKDVIKVPLLQKGQNDRIKNIISVFYGIQCSLNNFELSATIMTNSNPDHNTSASKTVELVHTHWYRSTIEHLWDELGRRVCHHQNPPEIL